MKWVTLGQFTMSTMQPYLGDALYQLTERYTCNKLWEVPAYEMGRAEYVTAAPLEPQLRQDLYFHPNVKLHAALAEYTCEIFGGERTMMFPGDKLGEVRLDASFGVEFKVPEGRNEDFELPNGSVLNGIVCPAYNYILEDESRCIKIDTRAGAVWLREKHKGAIDFGLKLFGSGRRPTYAGETVVHLRDWSYREELDGPQLGSPPWQGLRTKDTSGRWWTVEESSLTFSGGMSRLNLDDPYVMPFKQRPRIKLNPPYEVVWMPVRTRDIYIVLEKF